MDREGAVSAWIESVIIILRTLAFGEITYYSYYPITYFYGHSCLPI